MWKTALVVAIAFSLAHPAYGVGLFFSVDGVPEQEPIDGPPSEYLGPEEGINPVIDASAGTSRLYIWGMTDLYLSLWAVNFDVVLQPLEGDVSFLDWQIYNFESAEYPGVYRWDMLLPGELQPTHLDDVALHGYPVAGWGMIHEVAMYYGDLQYDPDTYCMLLGYVDLVMSPDAQAELYFTIGNDGWGSQPILEWIQFGWGDDPVDAFHYGEESALADAVIVPEPAGLALLLAAALALRRR